MANAKNQSPQNGSTQKSEDDKSEVAQADAAEGKGVVLSHDELERLRTLLSALVSDELTINPMEEDAKRLLRRLGVPFDQPAVSLPPPQPNLG